MLVMSPLWFARLVLSLLLIVFLVAVIAFASGLAAWVWLLYGPGAG